jgi:phage gp46-like protein
MAYSKTDGDIKFYKGTLTDTLLYADMRIDGYELLRDPGFESEVLILLFTDRRASEDDKLPNASDTRRGWWGDQFLDESLGSRLWLLSRANNTDETARLAEQYTVEALNVMVKNGEADSVSAVASRGSRPNEMNFLARVVKGVDNAIFFRFYLNWEKQIWGGLVDAA